MNSVAVHGNPCHLWMEYAIGGSNRDEMYRESYRSSFRLWMIGFYRRRASYIIAMADSEGAVPAGRLAVPSYAQL